MSRALYMGDSYLKEWDTKVKSVKDGKFVVLEDTAFYPTSGGQPHDEGTITLEDGEPVKVIYVGKFGDAVSHQVEPENVLKPGDTVHCKIDWDKRYRLMRMHTAAHIFMQVIHNATGALATGGQLGLEKSRIDFSLDDYEPEKFKGYIEKANDVIQQDLKISAIFTTREEAMKVPGFTKLAKGLSPDITDVRMLSIGDFDTQADGGTHVKSTIEIGRLIFLGAENKGKGRKRAKYTIEP
ncbi:alanyl-tRNA editing protein [Candidatus Woesearchaeota archaeon]|nr:alanyl-tRNA editing protein [Candidatus Woesearchaeota archaeon]